MTSLSDDELDDVAQTFPLIADGDAVQVVTLTLKAKKTKPPSAYTEGTLLADMRAAGKFVTDPSLRKMLTRVSGIGTSATRAETVESLKRDKYLAVAGKKIQATPRGIALVEWLDEVCPDLTNVATTAAWEARLDLIEQVGGGLKFESDITQQVREWIERLKKATPPSIPGGEGRASKPKTSTEKTAMSEAKKPTENMVAFANRLAVRLKQQLPADVLTSYEACSAFIDANKEAGMRPTEKQISFAERIAREKSVALPPDVLADGRRLSAWIDENK